MSQLLDDLQDPDNLPGGNETDTDRTVSVSSTHGSHVFLTAHDVFKVKRPKNFGFLDYSTLAKREHFCHEELRLNRRTAPDVYLGVVPVYRDAAGYSLTREGEIVDWAVHMRRLPDSRSAQAMLERGELDHDHWTELADYLHRFYASVDQSADTSASLRTSIEENFEQVAPFRDRFIAASRYEAIAKRQRSWLENHAERLASRPSYDGHGDLRLEHVYFFDSGPIVIDCIEFTERFRVGDWALDVAFLAMDLADHGQAPLGDALLGRLGYLLDDYDFWPLIDGYISYRAFVRGKVACFVASDAATPDDVRRRKSQEAKRYFELAEQSFDRPQTPPTLIAVGGRIASGKSTLAKALARESCAPIVSADATRKWLGGLSHDAPGTDALYQAGFTERVRDEVLRRAEQVLSSGRSVIVDTTFGSREFRLRAATCAGDQHANFIFVECLTTEAEARRRLRQRGKRGLSDAREEHWDLLAPRFEPVTELPLSEHRVVDGTAPPEDSARRLLDELGLQ